MGMGLGIKAAIARAICHPAIGLGIRWLRKDCFPYRGCVIETTSPTVRRGTNARLFWGLYVSCEVRYVRRHFRHDLDVVEPGARILGVTCRIRKRLDRDRWLLAVETSPKLVALARRSLERNGLARNVSILKRAICYERVRPSGSSWATVPSRGGPPIRPAGMRSSTCRRHPVGDRPRRRHRRLRWSRTSRAGRRVFFGTIRPPWRIAGS
jgi:hypothetical protein